MHAFLITGTGTTERQNAIQQLLDTKGIPSYDQVVLTNGDNPSIGITDIRRFIHELQLSARGDHGIAGVILDAGLLTTEAQQALLKTIEEPPPHVQLYLGVTSESLLLPTIVSRCQRILTASTTPPYTPDELSACNALIRSIRTATPGQRIHLIQTIGKTRDDAKRWIDCAIMACRSLTLSEEKGSSMGSETRSLLPLIHTLMTAKRISANNVNPFQLLEHLFLDNDGLDNS